MTCPMKESHLSCPWCCADRGAGSVRFRLQLTTPACPVKAEFERQARPSGTLCIMSTPFCSAGQLSAQASGKMTCGQGQSDGGTGNPAGEDCRQMGG